MAFLGGKHPHYLCHRPWPIPLPRGCSLHDRSNQRCSLTVSWVTMPTTGFAQFKWGGNPYDTFDHGFLCLGGTSVWRDIDDDGGKCNPPSLTVLSRISTTTMLQSTKLGVALRLGLGFHNLIFVDHRFFVVKFYSYWMSSLLLKSSMSSSVSPKSDSSDSPLNSPDLLLLHSFL